jgi:hypothetical protein
MRFVVKAMPVGDFDSWITQARSGGAALDDTAFAELAKPGTSAPFSYSSIAPRLFERIIDETAAGPQKARLGAVWCPPAAGEGR